LRVSEEDWELAKRFGERFRKRFNDLTCLIAELKNLGNLMLLDLVIRINEGLVKETL